MCSILVPINYATSSMTGILFLAKHFRICCHWTYQSPISPNPQPQPPVPSSPREGEGNGYPAPAGNACLIRTQPERYPSTKPITPFLQSVLKTIIRMCKDQAKPQLSSLLSSIPTPLPLADLSARLVVQEREEKSHLV